MPGPVVRRGDAITLRTIEPADAPVLARLVNDPAVRRGIARAQPVSVAEEREWIETRDEHNPDGVNLLVCANGEPVGTVGLSEVVQHWNTAQLGYLIDPDAWNRGYATDAVREVLDYGFDELGLARVAARVYATNPASARVLEKVGFTEAGAMREGALVDGERVDLRVFGPLADER